MDKVKLESVINDIFVKEEEESRKSNRFIVYRGCISQGITDSVYSCGDEDCHSCTMYSKSLDEALRNSSKYIKKEDGSIK